MDGGPMICRQFLTIHPNNVACTTGGVFAARIGMFVLLLILVTASKAEAADAPGPVVLPAYKAKLTGALTLQDEGDAATIHFWNTTGDTISWNWAGARPGRYQVEMKYSLDQTMKGGKVLITVGGQRIIVPVEPSGKWTDYRTFPLGVVSVDRAGDLPVVLQAAQLPEGIQTALPDVAWLSLTPTGEPATSDVVQHQPGEAQGKPLFDGKTFEGWEGDPTWFRIVDGAIIAGDLEKQIPRNEFLCTKREFGDFELRWEALLVKGRANGGVQFRSQRASDGGEMIGYQADCTPGLWGKLYDEGRRGTFLGTSLNSAQLAAVVKPDGWNACVIRCEGPRVRIWVNGVLALDYSEPDPTIPRKGYIGLQIHGGDPAEAWYKEIEIQELPSVAD